MCVPEGSLQAAHTIGMRDALREAKSEFSAAARGRSGGLEGFEGLKYMILCNGYFANTRVSLHMQKVMLN